jgi:hypothetical protein
VSAQGGLTLARGRLWLAGGNQISPASYDLATGRHMAGLPPVGQPNVQVPRGREIGVFQDKHSMVGGRLLYSGQGRVVTGGWFGYLEVDDQGRPRWPPACLRKHDRSGVPPAWDDEAVVVVDNQYTGLVCWSPADFGSALQALRPYTGPFQRPFAQPPKAALDLAQALRDKARWNRPDEEFLGVALAANAAVALAAKKRSRNEDDSPWRVCALDKEDGRPLWTLPLPSEPLLGGLTIDRNGRVIIVLKNGSVLCLGPKNRSQS